MLEMIYAIPENVGWVIVGAAGAFTAMVFVRFCKFITHVVKCNLDDTCEA